jgi:hypothetical protein
MNSNAWRIGAPSVGSVTGAQHDHGSPVNDVSVRMVVARATAIRTKTGYAAGYAVASAAAMSAARCV